MSQNRDIRAMPQPLDFVLRRTESGRALYLPGWLTSDGKLADYSGNKNHGTIVGAVRKPLPSGLYYLDFDGTDDIVTVTDAVSIQNIFASGGWAEAWIKVDSDGEGDLGRIFDKEGLRIFATKGEVGGAVKLYFAHSFSLAEGQWTTTNTVVTIGKWAHVGVVYNSSLTTNDPTILVNGVSVDVTENQTPNGVATTDVGSNLFIGNNSTTVRTFDGGIALERMGTGTPPSALNWYRQIRHLFRV